MKILPAIDLLESSAVRLLKGERDKKTVYSNDPVSLVSRFVSQGAKRIHVVDLEGAFEGHPVHTSLISKIVDRCKVPIQVGGGFRTIEHVRATVDNGASFVVLGTSALTNPSFVRAACVEFPGKIIVAVDAVNGNVAIEGWTESTGTSAKELGEKARDWGASSLLFTDVGRDGTEDGPAVLATAKLERDVGLPVIASGGVGSLEHLESLRDAGLSMVIVGRAIYEKRFSLEEATRRFQGESDC